MSACTVEVDTTAPVGETNPRELYLQRNQALIRQRQQSSAIERRYVWIRVVVFLVSVCLAAVCIGDRSVSWWWMSLPAILFAVLVPLHARCARQLQRCAAAQQFYAGCLERLDGRWQERASAGQQFSDPSHPWAVDLDLFGPGSLFQLMSECRTGPGKARLAQWMRSTCSVSDIGLRQMRSRGLRGELGLRESLAMINDQVDWTSAEKLLQEWVSAPPERISTAILWGSALLGLIAVPTAVAVGMGLLPFSALLLLMILQGPLIMLTRRQIQRVFGSMDSVDHALNQLAEVLVLFEQHPFADPSLQDLQCRLLTEGAPASVAIRRLSSLTRWQNHSLRNQFFAPIAWMCGLLVLLTDRLEKWREHHGHDVGLWLETTSEFEALVSVAAFRFDHPSYADPELVEDAAMFSARQLGHPLLLPADCVRNDVLLTAERPLMLISGSNMSGKSTLLRSVGTNLVLTFCGASVNAEALRTYPFQLATAMRISDSLQEGRSLFFSVVQRLKAVVDLTLQERTVLFLLDEILNGTNSHDRRRGAEAVIRSLVDRGALGMVTTHDLALTQIVDSLDGRAVNQHFEDTITNGKMTFDYQLRDGVVQRSNALELMRMLGLDV